MAHKVFVSYHHEKDQKKADYLKKAYGDDNTFIDRSLKDAYDDKTDDEILALIRTNHLKSSTVTIVLVGEETKNRKWVDWEIYASLRPYGERTINGLLAIYLPDDSDTEKTTYRTKDDAPARLIDNIDSGYAVEMKWSDISTKLKSGITKLESKINEAYNNRTNGKQDNSKQRRERNS